jgi:hypothetical protein
VAHKGPILARRPSSQVTGQILLVHPTGPASLRGRRRVAGQHVDSRRSRASQRLAHQYDIVVRGGYGVQQGGRFSCPTDRFDRWLRRRQLKWAGPAVTHPTWCSLSTSSWSSTSGSQTESSRRRSSWSSPPPSPWADSSWAVTHRRRHQRIALAARARSAPHVSGGRPPRLKTFNPDKTTPREDFELTSHQMEVERQARQATGASQSL